MDIEENYFRATEFRSPQSIPVGVSLMPATWHKYRDDLESLVLNHPEVFPGFKKGEKNFDSPKYQPGTWTDEWGCVWKNEFDGFLQGLVVGHPLSDWSALETYKPPVPAETLTHGFLFLRLCDLRGFENVMIDFFEDPPQLQRLIEIVSIYNSGVVKNWLAKNPRIVTFGEDLGMQDRLMMRPVDFRKYIKPRYVELMGPCRRAGAHVYMHSDGHILEIIDDLIECGVTIINPQIRANTLDGLAKHVKGKICISLDLDRQMFPFCTPADIDKHIETAVCTLGSPKGGLMLTAECGPDVPLANIEAICQSLEKHLHHRF